MNESWCLPRCPSQDGVGLAVYNRLIRAAGFEVRKWQTNNGVGVDRPDWARKIYGGGLFSRHGCRVSTVTASRGQ